MIDSMYELIGRAVVQMAWLRYGRQIKLAAGGLALVGLAAGYALSRRQPPEG
jgi:hypothetical protein